VKKMIYGLCLLALLAVVVAGCGGGESTSGGGVYGSGGGGESTEETSSSESSPGGRYGGSEGGEKTTASTGGGSVGVVKVAKVGDLGTIIVDSKGLTLYDFHKDKGGKSSCYGACAGAWPPLMTEGEPKAEAGAMSSKLGTTKRNDGTMQVTYAGWPLYTYAGDKGPGEANGNDFSQFGAQWYTLHPNGDEPAD
jgi:predicted lipoprotein with Yx(FWY)xxD motif